MNNLLDNFGTNCFSEKNLKNRVPDYVVKKFLEIKNGKTELTLEIADIIANAIKMWALEQHIIHIGFNLLPTLQLKNMNLLYLLIQMELVWQNFQERI